MAAQGGANLQRQIADAVLGFVKNLLPTLLTGFAAVLGVAWLPAKVKEIICLAGQKVKALIVRLLCKATKKLRELWNKLLKKNPKLAAQLGGAGCATKDDDTCNPTAKQKPCSKGNCFPAGTESVGLNGKPTVETLDIEDEMLTVKAAERESLDWPANPREDFTGRRVIHVVLDQGNGDRTDVKLLRSPEWLAEHVRDADGNAVYSPDENGLINVPLDDKPENLRCRLNMPEMGVEGLAIVTRISERPGDRPGDVPTQIPLEKISEYRRVTGTFRHSLGQVHDYVFEGETKPIGATPLHPFRSYDRNMWVSAGELRIGERVRGLNGPVRLESVLSRPNPEPVYTVEVEGDHVFRVGQQGLLVHNMSDMPLDTNPDTSDQGGFPYERYVRSILGGRRGTLEYNDAGDTQEIDIIRKDYLGQVKDDDPCDQWPKDSVPGDALKQLRRTVEAAKRAGIKQVRFITPIRVSDEQAAGTIKNFPGFNLVFQTVPKQAS